MWCEKRKDKMRYRRRKKVFVREREGCGGEARAKGGNILIINTKQGREEACTRTWPIFKSGSRCALYHKPRRATAELGLREEGCRRGVGLNELCPLSCSGRCPDREGPVGGIQLWMCSGWLVLVILGLEGGCGQRWHSSPKSPQSPKSQIVSPDI